MDMYTLNQIPSTPQIKKFLRRTLFGKSMWCPECRSRLVVKDHERYRCKKCRCRFSLLSHTWLANLKLPLQTFWMVLWCWTCAIPVKQAPALTGLSVVSIRPWCGLFRMCLAQETHVLERMVQIADAYFTNRTLVMEKQTGTSKVAFEVVM